MNTHELNEDLLTRYVLGELTDEETRAVKEALIANPEARKTVAELEQTVGMLKEALGGEALAGLGEAAKEEINAEAQRAQSGAERKNINWGRRLVLSGVWLSVAALVLMVVGVNVFQTIGTAGISPSVARERAMQIAEIQKLESRLQSSTPGAAGSPDPATATTEGLQSPPPVAEPLRYSQAETAAGEEIPSAARTEAEAAKEKKAEGNEWRDAGGAASPPPAPAAEDGGTPKDQAAQSTTATEPTAGLKLQSAVPLGARQEADKLRSGEQLGQETLPQQKISEIYKDVPDLNGPPPPAPAAAARSIESTQSMPSMEETRQLEALGYTDSMDGMDFEMRCRTRPSGEQYNPIVENPFKPVANEPLSTFSIDVDTGSYSNVRRYIEAGSLPPTDAVRIEEMINYFEYGYPKRTYEPGADPFSAAVSVAACPWTPGHKLVRVGIQGASMPEGQRPLSNLVFLLDVSGSMDSPDKLPLVKQGIQMLVKQLGENDKVSIVVYAGSAGVVLPPTNGSNRAAILSAIENLRAGGSTAGGEGIQLAYRLARENLIEGGVNRVILATDGDFNVGVSDEAGLIRLIEEQAKSKVFLTVLGFGTGNLQDGKMEQLSNKGNGMYAYIDSLREAKKVFVEQAEGSLITIAKDVKIQIEFNPARVQSYRLIGYENRALAAQDFNDDTKDAGEIGAGHQVTALYEIVPVGRLPQEGVDPLKYQKKEAGASEAGALPSGSLATSEYRNELMTLKLRYKQPEGDVSKLLEFPIEDSTLDFARADDDFRFASSVAAFGMLLRGSQYSGSATPQDIMIWAAGALGDDPHGYRAEFLDLLRKSAQLR